MIDFTILKKNQNELPVQKIKLLNLKKVELHNNIFILTRDDAELCKAECSKYILTFKGKVFNKKQLSNCIVHNDAQLVLDLYKKYGTNFLNKLSGTFSIAIISKFGNKILFATDHIGIVPIFYVNDAKNFAASTSLDVLKSLGFAKDLDLDILKDYVVQSYPRSGRCIYKNIRVLKGSHFVCLTEKISQEKKYFDFYKIKKNKTKSLQETVQSTRDIFLEVMQDHLYETNGKCSFSLSGGIDSSSVTCAASKYIDDIKTYSGNFHKELENFEKADESNYISQVVKHTKSKHKYILFDKYDYIEHIHYASSFDEPIFGSTIYINRKILDEAKKDGSFFHFEGAFGDEIVSHGYEYLMELGKGFNLIELFKQEKKLRRNKGLKFSYIQSIKNNFIRAFMPIQLQAFVSKNNTPPLEKNLKSNKHFSFIKHFKDINGYHPFLKNGKSNKDLHNLIVSEPVISYGARLYMLVAKRHEIQYFLPFLDRRFIENCLTVDSKYKLRDGMDRFYFRKSMSELVPKKNIMRNSKGDLSPLFLTTLKSFEPDEIEDLIFQKSNYLNELFCKDRLRKTIREFLDTGDWSLGSNINRLIVLSHWLEKNVL